MTQLFGSRMYVANASGCSSAYGGAMPMTPYSCDSRGFGPCWEQSLFEDNAEFAYGFLRAHGSIHGEVELRLKALKEKGVAVSEIGEYLAKWQDPAVTREVSDALIAALEKAEPTEEGDLCPAEQGVSDQEERVGLRRRRLGLRHRLRRH